MQINMQLNVIENIIASIVSLGAFNPSGVRGLATWLFRDGFDWVNNLAKDASGQLETGRAVQEGRALSFNGTSSVGTITGYTNPTSNFTFALRIKSNGNQAVNAAVVNASNDAFGIVCNSTTSIKVSVKTDVTTYLSSAIQLLTDMYEDIMVEFLTASFKVYIGINGEWKFLEEVAVSGTILTDSTILLGYEGASTYYFLGNIYDFRVWNKVLTDTEKENWFKKHSTIGDEQIFIKGDEQSGNTAYDSTINARNCSLSNVTHTTQDRYSWQNEIGYAKKNADPVFYPIRVDNTVIGVDADYQYIFKSKAKLSASLVDSMYANFDGTGDIATLAATTFSLDNNVGCSISFWARSDNVSQVNKGIFIKAASNATTGPDAGSGLYLRHNANGVLQVVVGNGAGSNTAAVSSNGAFVANDWKHFIVTIDPANIRIYVNNILQTTQPVTTGISIAASQASWIGAIATNYFDGGLCGFQLHNKILSTAERALIYANELVTSGLQLLLPMAEGGNTTLYDASGNSRHYTLTSASLITFWLQRTQSYYHYNLQNGFGRILQSVVNGNMEAGTGSATCETAALNFIGGTKANGWGGGKQSNTTGTVSFDTTIKRSGNQSLKVDLTAVSTAGVKGVFASLAHDAPSGVWAVTKRENAIPVVAGQTYDISVFVKATNLSGSRNVRLEIKGFDSAGAFVSGSNLTADASSVNQWERLVITLTVPATVTDLSALLWVIGDQNETHYANYDEFKVERVEKVPALAARNGLDVNGNAVTNIYGSWHNQAETKLKFLKAPSIIQSDKPSRIMFDYDGTQKSVLSADLLSKNSGRFPELITGNFLNGTTNPLDEMLSDGQNYLSIKDNNAGTSQGCSFGPITTVTGEWYKLECNYFDLAAGVVKAVLVSTRTGAGSWVSNIVTLVKGKNTIFFKVTTGGTTYLEINTSTSSNVANAIITNISFQKCVLANGGFYGWTGDNPDSWTVSTEDANNYVTQVGNAARFVSNGALTQISQAGVLKVGKRYRCHIRVTAAVLGTISFGVDNGVGGISTASYKNISAVGEYYFELLASSPTFVIKRAGACDITFTDVWLEECTEQGYLWDKQFIDNSNATALPTNNLGAELITNGTFSEWTGDNPNNWVLLATEDANNYVTENKFQCRIVSNGALMGINKVAILTVGKVYRLRLEITAITGGLNITDDFSFSQTISATGIYEYTFTATGTNLLFKRSNTCDVTFDNVSLKEIPNGVLSPVVTNRKLNLALYGYRLTGDDLENIKRFTNN